MKLMFYFSIFLLELSSLFALEINQDFVKKKVTLTCGPTDLMCYELCEKSSCELKESACYDCIGGNLELEYFFNYLGKMISKNSETQISLSHFVDFLTYSSFIFIGEKSPYNIYHGTSSDTFKLQLKSLCPNSQKQYVIVDMSGGYVQEFKYLLCIHESSSEIFELELNPVVNL